MEKFIFKLLDGETLTGRTVNWTVVAGQSAGLEIYCSTFVHLLRFQRGELELDCPPGHSCP
jgi:hypothetical protein